MRHLIGLALLGAIASTPAQATTIDLFYTGYVLNGQIDTSSGQGTVTFANGLSTPGYSDVTGFNFVLTDSSNIRGTGTTTVTIGDLQAFSAVLDSSGDIASMSLTTGVEANTALYPEQIRMFDLGARGTVMFQPGPTAMGNITQGQMVASVDISEPGGIALLGLGLAGLLSMHRATLRAVE